MTQNIDPNEMKLYNCFDSRTQLVIALNFFMEQGFVSYEEAKERLAMENREE